MRIIFTKHAAIDKFSMLKKHKFKTKITERIIKDIIQNPEYEEIQSEIPKIIIASKSIDAKHILRVVYRQEADIIIAITFYPAEKGRYYEKKASKN